MMCPLLANGFMSSNEHAADSAVTACKQGNCAWWISTGDGQGLCAVTLLAQRAYKEIKVNKKS